MSFKLCTILGSVMKSLGVPLHPGRDVNHPLVQRFLPVIHLVAISVTHSILVLVFK